MDTAVTQLLEQCHSLKYLDLGPAGCASGFDLFNYLLLSLFHSDTNSIIAFLGRFGNETDLLRDLAKFRHVAHISFSD